jgi:hypothetical protein
VGRRGPAWENRRLPFEESAPTGRDVDSRSTIRDRPGTVNVDRFRTMFVGANALLVSADVRFDADHGTDSDYCKSVPVVRQNGAANHR